MGNCTGIDSSLGAGTVGNYFHGGYSSAHQRWQANCPHAPYSARTAGGNDPGETQADLARTTPLPESVRNNPKRFCSADL